MQLDQDLHQDLLPRPQARALCQLPWIQGAQPGLPLEVNKHGKNTMTNMRIQNKPVLPVLYQYNDKYTK